jgi:hypothetical protein
MGCQDVAEGERWVVLKLQSEKDVNHVVADGEGCSHKVAEGKGWFDVNLNAHFVFKPSISPSPRRGLLIQILYPYRSILKNLKHQ